MYDIVVAVQNGQGLAGGQFGRASLELEPRGLEPSVINIIYSPIDKAIGGTHAIVGH